MRFLLLALFTALLTGCGSGGAAGNAVDQGSGPGTATIVLSTGAASAATVIYAVEFVLQLPAGVTLATDPANGEVMAGVLHAADSGALAGARYVPATGATRAFVKVNIADPYGFVIGDLATITCNVSQGADLSAAGFVMDGFSAIAASDAVITPHVAVQTQ